MRILNWNLRRPTAASSRRNTEFHRQIAALSPDIAILTETNAAIHPGPGYESAASLPLPAGRDGIKYAAGENRASIFSRYPITAVMPTADPYTSVCATIATPHGPLLMYATIIGVFGGRGIRFDADFAGVCADLAKMAPGGDFCLAGDFNISFSGYPYPAKETIRSAHQALSEADLSILTAPLADVPDHIACSKAFSSPLRITTTIVPVDNRLSDHAIVLADLLSITDGSIW